MVYGNYGPFISSGYVAFKHIYDKHRVKARNITGECYAGFLEKRDLP